MSQKKICSLCSYVQKEKYVPFVPMSQKKICPFVPMSKKKNMSLCSYVLLKFPYV